MKRILTAAVALLLVLSLLMGTACAQSMYPEFREIFDSRSINPVFRIDILRDWDTSVVLAGAFPDGTVDLHEIAASPDTDEIKMMVNFIYFPFAGKSELERMTAESTIRSDFAKLAGEDFVDVSYDMQNDYFIVEICYKDLDNKKNVRRLGKHCIVPKGSKSISFEDTKNTLLAQGYVEGGLMW